MTSALLVLAGALWGLTNLYLMQQLLQELLVKGSPKPLKAVLLLLIKFPLLYGIGFALLYFYTDEMLPLLGGFTASLIINLIGRRRAAW